MPEGGSGTVFEARFRQKACSLTPAAISERSQRAGLAQLVEHIIRNDGVACSSHAAGTSAPKR